MLAAGHVDHATEAAVSLAKLQVAGLDDAMSSTSIHHDLEMPCFVNSHSLHVNILYVDSIGSPLPSSNVANFNLIQLLLAK